MSSAWQRGKLINRTKNDWRINKQLIRTESEWKDYAMSTFIRDINCTNWINIRLLKIFHVCIFNQSNGLGVNLRPSSKSVFRHPLFRVFKWCFLLFYFLCTIYTYTYLLGGNQGLNSGVHYFWFKIFNNRNGFNFEQI